MTAKTWTTSTTLAEQIAQCERQIIAIRLKADEKVQKEEERALLVAAKREELIDAHRNALAEAQAEFEHQMSNIVNKAEQEIQDASHTRAQSMERGHLATQRAESAEQQVHERERYIAQLHGRYDRTVDEYDARMNETILRADEQVRQTERETERIVQNASRYASEIQDGTLDSIDSMHDDVRTKADNAEASSKERSRFLDLCNVALNKGHNDLSDKEFEDIKHDLIRTWYEDWSRNTPVLASGATGTHQLRMEECLKANTPLTPLDSTRPRSVERTRQRLDQSNSPPFPASPNAVYRPQTAP